MRILFLLTFIWVELASCTKQNFELKFSSIENLLLKDYSLNEIKDELGPNFKLVIQDNLEWRFRDDSKNWESIITVTFDSTTKVIRGILFTAPYSRLIEYSDELEKKLGYAVIRKINALEEYKNSSKNLGAHIYKTINNIYGDKIILYGIYNNSFVSKNENNKELIGTWFTPHVASVNIKFNTDQTFEFNDYNESKKSEELHTGSFELTKDILTLHYSDRQKQDFKFYKGEHGDDRYYIKNSTHYFIKQDY